MNIRYFVVHTDGKCVLKSIDTENSFNDMCHVIDSEIIPETITSEIPTTFNKNIYVMFDDCQYCESHIDNINNVSNITKPHEVYGTVVIAKYNDYTECLNSVYSDFTDNELNDTISTLQNIGYTIERI